MTMNPPPPPHPGAPPPGYYQGPPPKKRHTLRNVLLGLVLVFILFTGGCIALIGLVANEADKAIKDEEANDRPRAITAGTGFTHDDFEVPSGWKVSKDGLGSVMIKDLRVTNKGGDQRHALLSFRFYKGKENLAEVECHSNELQAGESSKMDCLTLDDGFPTGYDAIKVADSW